MTTTKRIALALALLLYSVNSVHAINYNMIPNDTDSYNMLPDEEVQHVAVTTAAATRPSPVQEKPFYPPHRSNWTFPGNSKADLIRHLTTNPNHSHDFDLTGVQDKSYSELMAAHASDHEGRLHTDRYKAKPEVFVNDGIIDYTSADPALLTQKSSFLSNTYAYGGPCPGGRCPLPMRTYSSSNGNNYQSQARSGPVTTALRWSSGNRASRRSSRRSGGGFFSGGLFGGRFRSCANGRCN